jgi:hypothetical protein
MTWMARSAGQGGLVDAGADQGIVDIHDVDDPRLQGDSVAGQSVWIAAAIPVLVMAAGDAPGALEERAGGEHAFAGHGVGLHDAAFLVGKPPGLLEDAVGHMHLADVVKNGREADRFGLLRAQSDAPRQQFGMAPDAADVSAGVFVLGLAGDGEHVDGVEVGLVQLGGALQDALLEGLRLAFELDGLLEDGVAQLGDDLILLPEAVLGGLLGRQVDDGDDAVVAELRAIEGAGGDEHGKPPAIGQRQVPLALERFVEVAEGAVEPAVVRGGAAQLAKAGAGELSARPLEHEAEPAIGVAEGSVAMDEGGAAVERIEQMRQRFDAVRVGGGHGSRLRAALNDRRVLWEKDESPPC